MSRTWLKVAGILVLAAVLVLVLGGCAKKAEQAGPASTETSAAGRAGPKTVASASLQNPENKPVYVCVMQEHKDQVSLDATARCSLCGMKVIPMTKAEKVWGAAEKAQSEQTEAESEAPATE
jgi:hypothetical protein